MKLITVEYIRTNFIFDILSCVPLIVTRESVIWLYPFKIFRVTKMSRIIDFIMMWSQLLKDRYQRYQITIDNMYKTMTTVVSLIFFLHLMACAWIAIGLIQHTPDSIHTTYWIERTYFVTNAKWRVYWTSWYFITTTITTVGYGDFYAVTIIEKLFNIILLFTGILCFTVI